MKRIFYFVVAILFLASVAYAQSPLGGLIYLIKNTNGTTLYRGQIVTGDSLSTVLTTPYSVVKVAASSNFAIGTVYSDSILPNSLGWMTVSGAGYVAVLNTKVDSVIPKNRILYVSATAGLANCRVRTLFTGSAAQIGIPISKMIGRNVNLDSICIANIFPTNVPDSGGVYKFGVVLADTLRMSSDPTVALIFLRGRGDSAWAFKARKGTTTWNTLMWADTLGSLYQSATITSGGAVIAANGYAFRDAVNTYSFVPSTGIFSAKTATVDTLKAKVVATTAQSQYHLGASTVSAFWTTGFIAGRFLYTVTNSSEGFFQFPHHLISGAKVRMDSAIVYGALKAATDSVYVWKSVFDTAGVYTQGATKDTIAGTGSKATFRRAIAWDVADTLFNDNKAHGLYFVTDNTLTDTVFLRGITFKYHTIPGP